MRLHLFFVAGLFLFLSSCTSNAQTNEQAAEMTAAKVEVIDFYGKHRCMTCQAIERKTEALLQESFAEEMANGTVVFRTVNVDEEANYELAKSFEASGTALFVHILANGESEKIDLTSFAFMNANGEDGKFEEGLTEEVNKALQKL